MLKRVGFILIMAFMLAGCGNGGNNPEESEQTVTQTQESVADEIVEEITDEQPQPEEEVVVVTDATYTYEDMTVTPPDAWEGKYLIKESEDGFAFFQKASYEKAEGTGFLCGFYKSDNMVDQSAGATQLAYTDSYMYYMQEPTDVSCYYEDEAIASEYFAMMEENENLKKSLGIGAENVKFDAQEFVFPMSDTKLIPDYILVNMSEDELWIARNEIYARHGRRFTNAYLSGYFASCSWYEPGVSAEEFDESSLSQTELDNLDLIKAYEETKKAEKQYPVSQEFDKGYKVDLNGDGQDEELTLTYYEDKENYLYQVSMVLDGDMVYDLCSEDVYYFSLNTEEYFVTDISPHYEGLELAVMDYGMSEDLVTHFYTFDGEGLHYIGCVEGFPFKEYQNLDGFAWDGGVKSTMRTDLIHTCFSYGYWYYNYDEKKLELQDIGLWQMVPDEGHSLAVDIPVYESMDVSSDTITLKAQEQIFFMETDGEEWIKVKGKDGTVGYLHITDRKIDNVEQEPQEIISGLFFAG